MMATATIGRRRGRHRFARRATAALCASVAIAGAGCGNRTSGSDLPPDVAVRERIASLAPSANLGHRGTGPTRPGHALPENSIPSYEQAIAEGADGIELDVELTLDGELVIMHDDTLDRTTTCSGCVNAYTLAEVRECLLLDGEGQPTDLHPPVLEEAYGAIPDDALVNVELKVYDEECLTETTGPVALAHTAVAEIERLDVASRTIFSSFDEVAALAVKEVNPDLYSAQLMIAAPPEAIAWVAEVGLDAVHPFYLLPAESVRQALDLGLQVNVWTVDGEAAMNLSLDKGVTAIITDEPGVLAEVIAERR